LTYEQLSVWGKDCTGAKHEICENMEDVPLNKKRWIEAVLQFVWEQVQLLSSCYPQMLINNIQVDVMRRGV